jgi:hypothetical protein
LIRLVLVEHSHLDGYPAEIRFPAWTRQQIP